MQNNVRAPAPGLRRSASVYVTPPPPPRAGVRKIEGTRMMNGKAVVPLIAGLCIGGFALKMVFDTVKKAKGAQTAMTQVWAAKVDIPLGVMIDESMITPVAFPSKSLPQGVFEKKDKLIGRVPMTTAISGLPIVDSMLHPAGAPPGLWVKEGFRAVAVRIDESSGVNNHLYPGCFVDVVGYFNIRRGARQETIARTIIEDVEVAAVGERLSLVTDTQTDSKKKPQPARAVTLFVKPDQVPTLHLAEQRGKIKLSMRNKEESLASSTKDSPIVTEAELTGAEEEEKKAAQPNQLAGLFAGFFQPKTQPDSQPAPQPQAAVPAPQPAPVIAQAGWVTRIHNGDRSEEIQWRNRFSSDRFDPEQVANRKPSGNSAGKQVQPNGQSNDEEASGPAPQEGNGDDQEVAPVDEPEESPE